MNNILKNTLTLFIYLFPLIFPVWTQAQPTKQWDKTFGGSLFDDLSTAVKTNEGFIPLFGRLCLCPNGKYQGEKINK